MTLAVRENATRLVRSALKGTGIELVASCDVASYDAHVPPSVRSAAWLEGARGVVVAASAGPALWRAFRMHVDARPALWNADHPYDEFVAHQLARANDALAAAGIGFCRFEPTLQAPVRLDFIALAELVGLGAPGPFALAIHPEHGPWWALRGAWIVDAEVDPAVELERPCRGCAAPCVGGPQNTGALARASAEVRALCVVGQASRYDDDQIGYHYNRAATAARLRGLPYVQAQKSGS